MSPLHAVTILSYMSERQLRMSCHSARSLHSLGSRPFHVETMLVISCDRVPIVAGESSSLMRALS